MGRVKLGAEGQLLVPEEGMHSEEYAHKHTDVPRFGALARGNTRTSCMSDHIELSMRATAMLLELYV